MKFFLSVFLIRVKMIIPKADAALRNMHDLTLKSNNHKTDCYDPYVLIGFQEYRNQNFAPTAVSCCPTDLERE